MKAAVITKPGGTPLFGLGLTQYESVVGGRLLRGHGGDGNHEQQQRNGGISAHQGHSS
jgi:hypothetical protein